jgi:phosphoribosylaminoimidazolecarboxamide formyltransferase / IMP cyclohydrolase
VRALLSVYDKDGLLDFARGLEALGVELIASGQTSAALSEAGIAHSSVESITGSPEMLGGRVKTLHPKIHGGILADRSKEEHLKDLEDNDITAIDLVVCNLYPFSSDPSVELIDVGGPTMVRAAAKNFAHVGVVVAPEDYDLVLAELRSTGSLSATTRGALAKKAFAHTAAYDAAIVAWLNDGGPDGSTADGDPLLPATLPIVLERREILRYGENPHQRGARYVQVGTSTWWDHAEQLSGTALSYLNLFDADAAWRLVHELADDADGQPAVAIIKHANACGAAVAESLSGAFAAALDADPLSAFGGIVALSRGIDEAVAAQIAEGPQADVIIAPMMDEQAVEILRARRKATRLLVAQAPEPMLRQIRSLSTGFLVQGADELEAAPSTWTVVTQRQPTDQEWRDLILAWRVCARTTSNAIALARGDKAVGIGAGQQSRVVAAEIAVAKASGEVVGSAGASDAFFPFPDGLEVLINAGVSAVVQPGGSVRDDEVTKVADAAGITMIHTGERHFRH